MKELDSITIIPKDLLPENVELVGNPFKITLSEEQIKTLIKISEIEDMIHYTGNFNDYIISK